MQSMRIYYVRNGTETETREPKSAANMALFDDYKPLPCSNKHLIPYVKYDEYLSSFQLPQFQ